jgi:hypothetical protein
MCYTNVSYAHSVARIAVCCLSQVPQAHQHHRLILKQELGLFLHKVEQVTMHITFATLCQKFVGTFGQNFVVTFQIFFQHPYFTHSHIPLLFPNF